METTEEERQQWAAMLQRFFQVRQPATRAEGLDTQKAKEQDSRSRKRVPRLSSQDLLCALDYQLRCVCGFGLAGFAGSSRGGELQLEAAFAGSSRGSFFRAFLC